MESLVGMLLVFLDIQEGRNNRVGNHMFFAMIYCTEKNNRLFFLYGNDFCLFLSLFW